MRTDKISCYKDVFAMLTQEASSEKIFYPASKDASCISMTKMNNVFSTTSLALH